MDTKNTITKGSRRHTGADKYRFFCVLLLILCMSFSGCSGPEKTEADAGAKPAPEPVIIHMEDDGDKESEADTVSDEEASDEDTSGEELTGETEESEPEPVYDEADYFYDEPISDSVFARMEGKSFPADCVVAREDLRYLRLLYKDIEGNTHEGEMICNASIAGKLTDIFRQLYEADYPIEHMSLIDDYDGDDDASMSANNTSCFNYRVVKGTKKISKHGYGLAVDINPKYNPYIHKLDGKTVIEPEGSEEYADRAADFDYKIDEDDLAYKLFTQAGFTWGGSWNSVKDYQHFQMD